MYICIYVLRNVEQSFEKSYFIVKSKNPPPPFSGTKPSLPCLPMPQIVSILNQTNRFHFLLTEFEDPFK